MALTKALKTDLSSLAQIIQSKGRGRDTVLAHITPQEAALLKKRGGRGSINPDTGLPEFEDDLGGDMPIYVGGVEQTPTQVAAANPDLYAGGVPTPEDRVQTFGIPKELSGKGMEAINQYYADRPYQAQGLSAEGTPSGLGDYSLASGVPTVGLGQIGVPGGTGQGLVDTGVVPLYTGATETGRELSSLAFDPSLGKTSREALQQSRTSPEKESTLDKALAQLGITAGSALSGGLARAGLTAGLGAYGASQSKQAAAQNEAAAAKKSAIASPYQQQGQELVRAAQSGELTAANQQVIQQQRARLAQASANMGGVGQQQIESQISSLTSQLLDNQYKYGLQVMQIGDNIELGAINTQLQLDQQLNAANKSFYTSLAQLAAGSPMYVPGLYPSTPTRT